MAARTESDPRQILAMANAGIPLQTVEIWRLASASGERVPKARRFRQFAEETEAKFRELLRAELGEEIEDVLSSVKQVQPRRRRRRQRA